MIGLGISPFIRRFVPSWPAISPLGTLINEPYANLNNWTLTNPDSVFTVSGGDLLINKPAASGYNFNNYGLETDYNGSCLENWTITVNFKLTEISASSSGFAVGVRSTAAVQNHHLVQFNTNSADPAGRKLYFYMAGSLTATTSSASQLTASVNDECTLVVTRTADAVNAHKITATVTNLTNPNSVTHSYTFGESYPQTTGTPPTSRFAIYGLVGTVTIHDYVVTTALYKNINILAVGNSITRGLYSGSYNNRWTSLLYAGSSKTNYSAGGPGDITSMVLDRINELINFNPNYVLLAIGGNDLPNGVPIATAKTNYQSIVTQLTKAGRIIFHCKPTPRNSYDYTVWNAWLDATFTNVIDTWTPLKDGGTGLNATYDAGDGIHPNQAGHALIYSTVNAVVSSYK